MITPEADYDRWLAGLDAGHIRVMFTARGCAQILVKQLADRQDNDKNQVYVGMDLNQVGKIPSGEVIGSRTRSNKAGALGQTKFMSAVDFVWLSPEGESVAPEAKLIYYPQYPEVRLSGLLKGSPNPPRSLYVRNLRGQEAGRHLLIGLQPDGSRVWSLLLPRQSDALSEINTQAVEPYGVFRIWDLTESLPAPARDVLVGRLASIHAMGWIPGQRISKGAVIPYRAPNAGGYTLESLLDVSPNSKAEPDFEGWEIKGHTVRDLERPGNSAITLMTPEPTGGAYRADVESFLRTYGYSNPGVEGRFDFTGRHFVGAPMMARTGTRLVIQGWDGGKGIDPDGAIVLLGEHNEVAASWAFTGLMSHWKAKHSRCCYVPYRSRDGVEGREFWFGPIVRLCEDTKFLDLLKGFRGQAVYYDPGLNMKLEGQAWRIKKRSQFRVAFTNVPKLYSGVEDFDVRGDS